MLSAISLAEISFTEPLTWILYNEIEGNILKNGMGE